MIDIKIKKLNGFGKTKGLVGAAKPYPIFFQTRWGIHTFGLKFPIDVLILDKTNRVIKIKENLKPNHVFFWNPKSNLILELPVETIIVNNIKIGDKIRLNEIYTNNFR